MNDEGKTNELIGKIVVENDTHNKFKVVDYTFHETQGWIVLCARQSDGVFKSFSISKINCPAFTLKGY